MARWKGLKGALWTVFSQYIRMRDCFKYGTCVSCGTPIEWNGCDAGHFIAVSAGCPLKLIFDERNVNAQCKRCNNPYWTPDAAYPYSIELDRRWGRGTAKKLLAMKKESHGPWSELEYKAKIKHYKDKLKDL